MCNIEIGTYVVLRVYKSITPSVVFTTNIREDAVDYANIMKRSEPDYDFAVAEVRYKIYGNQK